MLLCSLTSALSLTRVLEHAATRPISLHAASAAITVTNTHDNGPGSLRQALVNANAGDTVKFALGANSIISLTSGELVVTKALTIDGSDVSNLKLSADGSGRVFHAMSDVTLVGLAIADGFTFGSGGGIFAQAGLTLTNVILVDNATATSRSNH